MDRVTITAKKSNGTLESIVATIGFTEAIAPESLATGVRLAALDEAGTVVRTATAKPSLDFNDPSTIRWTLSRNEWEALSAGAANLSAAVSEALRTASWGGNVPVMPPPAWALAALPIHTSRELPVELSESIATLNIWLEVSSGDATATRELYKVDALSLLASSGGGGEIDDVTASRLHALPFAESFTALDYARARWYDRSSGTWLTPDPRRNRDSSDLYAFGGGEPVNTRDPSGAAGEDQSRVNRFVASLYEQPSFCADDPGDERCIQGWQAYLRSRVGDDVPTITEVGVSSLAEAELAVLFINGMTTTESTAHSYGRLIADDIGQAVTVVWNPTRSLAFDFVQSAAHKLGMLDNSVRITVATIRAKLKNSSAVTIYAHSQGAIIASNAVSHLSLSEQRRVNLITFGGAAWSYPTGLRSQTHVVNYLDFVVAMPLGQGVNAIRAVPGDGADGTIFVEGILGHDFRAYWRRYWTSNSPVARKARNDAIRRSRERANERSRNGWPASSIH